MIFFKAISDLNFMCEFRNKVLSLWKIEAEAASEIAALSVIPRERQAAVQSRALGKKDYLKLREWVAMEVSRASHIARLRGAPIDIQSIPPRSVGGVILPINIFYTILQDTSYGGVSNQMILDAINLTIGGCTKKVRRDFWRLINPFYWIKELIKFILRIPFLVIKTTGFDVSKIEDHLFGRLFKLLELGVLIYILIRLGLKIEAIQQFVLGVFGK